MNEQTEVDQDIQDIASTIRGFAIAHGIDTVSGRFALMEAFQAGIEYAREIFTDAFEEDE